MALDIRALQSGPATELYLTAAFSSRADGAGWSEDAFSSVARALRGAGARIVQERVFAAPDAASAVAETRRRLYGELDDGVPPAWLASGMGPGLPLAGVQVHAVAAGAGAPAPRVLSLEGAPLGRAVPRGRDTFVFLTGLTAARAGDAPAQAGEMFRMARALLRQAGADMVDVARTWLWLGGIVDWYGELNRVRTRFYDECGLLDGRAPARHLPASTGIGVRPASGAACALDVWAATGRDGLVTYYPAAGRQDSAFRYGSAFSRAARAESPAGETVFVSGTAAIDEKGNSQYPGDAGRQIEATLANVRAVLRDTNCSDADVVSAIAYCKTSAVEDAFREVRRRLPYPCVVAVADVCRDELLFELEATACPGARRL